MARRSDQYQKQNQPFYTKYWEIFAWLALLTIGCFVDKKTYSIILISISNVPLFFQALKSKQYNTAISFILLIKLFMIVFIAVMLSSRQHDEEQIIGIIFHVSLLACSIVALAQNRYSSPSVTTSQIVKEVAIVIVCIFGIYVLSNFGRSFTMIVIQRAIVEIMLTVYLLVVKKHEGISGLWMGLNVLQKFFVMWFMTQNGIVLFKRRFIIIALEFINFVLTFLFKYGCLNANLSNYVKDKYDVEFGDNRRDKEVYEKRV